MPSDENRAVYADGDGSAETPRCPVDGCENPELDATPDDEETDWFCHWCGNLFVEDGGGLDVF